MLGQLLPGVSISLSHQVATEWREYERTASTVMDAYIAPPVSRYMADLSARLRDRGMPAPLRVMQSNGGVISAQSASERPLQTLLSGPVGGAAGGVALAEVLGRPNLICIDLGGTSFDVSLITAGQADSSPSALLEGLPVLMPVVDIHTIGAGGGSLAYLEAGGTAGGTGERRPPIPDRPATGGEGPVPPSQTPTCSWAASTPTTSWGATSPSTPEPRRPPSKPSGGVLISARTGWRWGSSR